MWSCGLFSKNKLSNKNLDLNIPADILLDILFDYQDTADAKKLARVYADVAQAYKIRFDALKLATPLLKLIYENKSCAVKRFLNVHSHCARALLLKPITIDDDEGREFHKISILQYTYWRERYDICNEFLPHIEHIQIKTQILELKAKPIIFTYQTNLEEKESSSALNDMMIGLEMTLTPYLM